MKKLVIALIGPTASGKTALGIAVAAVYEASVISADSRQVYAGLNRGTAKPEVAWVDDPHAAVIPDAIEGVDHYLLNVSSPTNRYTVADWQRDATAVIDQLHAANTLPLVVGGTMQYVDSLVFNWQVPAVQPDAAFRKKQEARSTEQLYDELIQLDPNAAEFVEPHNTRRIIRALEVMRATGKPYSKVRERSDSLYSFKIIGLQPNVDVLREKILTRSKEMMRSGLLAEAASLRDLHGDALLKSTIHYEQALAVLDGLMTEDEAIEDMVQKSMRYVRRQMSWWRGRDDITWIDPDDSGALENILDITKATV